MKGVTFDRHSGKWAVRAKNGTGRRTFLGYYLSEEEACIVLQHYFNTHKIPDYNKLASRPHLWNKTAKEILHPLSQRPDASVVRGQETRSV